MTTPCTFVALLRGINVGKAKRLPMGDLRSLLEGLGFTRVATLLASGNAVFCATGRDPDAHATRIGTALADRLGLEVPIIVLSAGTLAEIVAENPLPVAPDEPSRVLVAFVRNAGMLDEVRALQPRVNPPDELAVGRHAAYLRCPAGLLASPTATTLLAGLGTGVTTRNWATTLKLDALARKREAGTRADPDRRGVTDAPQP